MCGANDHNYAYCNSNLGESDGALLLSSKQKISTMMMHNDNSTIWENFSFFKSRAARESTDNDADEEGL